jgi:hypothetical protein
MIIIEKRKETIRKSNHYYNNGNAIRCDDDPLFSERGVKIFSGKYFEHYALRITR